MGDLGESEERKRCTNSAGAGSPEAHPQHSASLLTGAGSTPAPRCSPGDLSDDIEPLREGILSSFLHNICTWGYVTCWPLAVYNELVCCLTARLSAGALTQVYPVP